MTMEQNHSTTCLLHQDHLSDSDEEAETLSLRDLPIHGENDYAEEDHGSSSDEHDHFEFFSEEWSSPMSSAADNIIFCGKLIANKDFKQSNASKTYDQRGECMNANNGYGLRYAQNFNSVSASKCMNKIEKCEDKNNMLAYKITIYKSPTRSRWFLFLFGSAKIPAEMEIRDIRRRQIKKSMSQQSLGGGSAVLLAERTEGLGGGS